jgi:hypothetical protein
MEKQEVFVVKYEDLDEFINHHYPNLLLKFDFIADEEMTRDSEKEIIISGELRGNNRKMIQNGETGFMTKSFLNDLCKREIIPSGTYLIRVR